MFIGNIEKDISVSQHGCTFQFHYKRMPILKVSVMGVVVRISLKRNSVTYYVDDGTGVIRCVKYLNNPNADTFVVDHYVQMGNLVSAKGNLALSETNEDMYGFVIMLSVVDIVEDPNEEALHWLSAIKQG